MVPRGVQPFVTPAALAIAKPKKVMAGETIVDSVERQKKPTGKKAPMGLNHSALHALKLNVTRSMKPQILNIAIANLTQQFSAPNDQVGCYEHLCYVVHYFSYKDLLQLERVSKAWQKALLDCWQPLYMKRFGITFSWLNNAAPPWKKLYKWMHFIVKPPQIGRIDIPLPQDAVAMMGSDTAVIAQNLPHHVATGAYYALSVSQGSKEATLMLSCLAELQKTLSKTLEEELNQNLLQNICLNKLIHIIWHINQANVATCESSRASNLLVVLDRLKMITAGKSPAKTAQMIDSMQELTLLENPKPHARIWQAVRRHFFSDDESTPHIELFVGSSPLPEGITRKARKIDIVFKPKITRNRQLSCIEHSSIFQFWEAKTQAAECALSYDERAEPRVLRAHYSFTNQGHANLKELIEQFVYEVALREKVDSIELSQKDSKDRVVYRKKENRTTALEYLPDQKYVLALKVERFSKPLLAEQGRVLPTPRHFPIHGS